MKGAPIRFVVAVVGGWTCVRVAVLLPGVTPLALAGDVLAPPAEAKRLAAPPMQRPVLRRDARAGPASSRIVRRTAVPRKSPVVPIGSPTNADRPFVSKAAADPATSILVPATLGLVPDASTPRRWSTSAWLLARGGTGGTLSGGRLGASQAGARVLYRVDSARRVSIAGRVAAPLQGRGAEAAIGIDWQPTAAPVHLVAEQRIGLDGGRGGPTAMAIAGLNPTPVAAGFRLEAYAQAGAILRDGRAEAFGDGAARLARPVRTISGASIDVGVGVWAAGQRGATRADIGPTIGVALPVAGRGVRLSLDWRHRVAGRARPNSGPSLSIGNCSPGWRVTA